MKVILRRHEAMGDLQFATDEELDTDRVTIGRGTDQHVELPDMRLSLEHSEIREAREGEFQVESKALTGVWVNGVPAPTHALRTGDVIDCGRFRITVGAPPPEADLLLEIVERISAREEKSERRSQYLIGLAEGGLGMRKAAWIGALAILVLVLALPLLLRLDLLGAAASGESLDRIWEAGPRSSAHRRFLGDCVSCHQEPFQRVANEACLTCHAGVGAHSDSDALNAMGGMGDARCGSCHLEHSGVEALRAGAPDDCTGCHAGPDPRFASAQLLPASRFSRDHPPFSPRLPRYQAGGEFRFEESAWPEGSRLVEDTNLRFPHDTHLNQAGIRAPGGNRVLVCADCHAPEGRGEGFRPVQMREHCADCHRLDFDPDDVDRLLPHAQPAEVARVIRDHYARRALAGTVKDPSAPAVTRLRRLPGEALDTAKSRAAMEWADARAGQVIDEVFERRVCGTCHDIERTEDPALPWRVAPVQLTRSYLTGARFDHAAHRTETCSRCHDAKQATASTSLMLPDLANCRECHGEPGQSGMVPTACAGCHSFHTAHETSMAPAQPAKAR